MRNKLTIAAGLFLSFFALETYAIQVTVQSSSQGVAALGLTVNGKSHGGAGKSYSKSGLPAGMYSFGVRVGGVFGTDVGCATSNGKKSIQLNNDATAVLNYDGKRCTMQISR